MRIGLLISGIVLMIIGVGLYFSIQSSVSDCASFVGQLGRTFSSDVQQRCQMASGVQIGASILFVVGIGLTIGGAVAKGGDSKIGKWKNPKKYLREEYEAGYEEVKSKDEPVKSKEEPQGKDNIKYMGILKERLARGEITKEEYDSLKKEFETS